MPGELVFAQMAIPRSCIVMLTHRGVSDPEAIRKDYESTFMVRKRGSAGSSLASPSASRRIKSKSPSVAARALAKRQFHNNPRLNACEVSRKGTCPKKECARCENVGHISEEQFHTEVTKFDEANLADAKVMNKWPR